MSDSDLSGKAWLVAPSEYLARRERPYFMGMPRSFYVAMRDGCRLAVDLYLPQDKNGNKPPEKFPTIVIFTPYNRRFRLTQPGIEPAPNTARYRDTFVPAGYAVLVVDVRGCGASFGTRDSLRSPAETADFAEMAEWISQQPWSDGTLGSTGISYLGAAACFLAGSGHPAVKAIAPLFAVSDIYSEQLYPGGLLSTVWVSDYDEMMVALDQDDRELVKKFGYFNNPGFAGPQPVDEDADGQLLSQALAEHRNNFKLAELVPQFLFRDESTWHDPGLTTSSCSPYAYYSKIRPDVAIYSVSGWYDGGGYSNGTITRYQTLAGSNRRLLLGPWDHGARTNVSPWRSKPESDFPLMAEVLRFFDQHLMGLDTGLDAEAPVHFYSIHADTWCAATAWPPRSETKQLALESNRTLALERSGGEGEVSFRSDFNWSTGSQTRYERLGGHNTQDYYGDWQQREPALTSFDTNVLKQPVSICGNVLARLRISSSEGDAAVYLYLSEVLADGTIRYITEGMLRLLHRRTSEPPEYYKTDQPFRSFSRGDACALTPGVSELVEISLLPVAWMITEGSKIRLSISGADHGHFPQVPPGRPAILTIATGGDAGSVIDLPVFKFPASS